MVREGEGEGGEDEIMELEERIEKAHLPEHALKAAQKELKVPDYPYTLLASRQVHEFVISETVLYTETQEFTSSVSRACSLKVYMCMVLHWSCLICYWLRVPCAAGTTWRLCWISRGPPPPLTPWT